MQLKDRHVVITGAASGIGRAMAQRFAREGARGVVVADIDGSGAEEVAREIVAERPGAALAVGCDVADVDQIASLIETARESFGPIGLFCANAGIGGGTGLEETSDAQWDEAFAVNVRSHVIAARLLIPEWVERGEGYFLSTASAAGLLTVIGSVPYAVTKHAAVAFAEWLAITYGDRGVRVSCLCPMGVQTPMLEEGLEQPGEAGVGMRIVAQSGTVLDPAAVADAVVAGLEQERFLILPHPEVAKMFAGKAADHDGWLAAMRHVRERVAEAVAQR
jgi:NAD(P)-dependent dehydrogenase (short-subunit alcohol dehydrogenase family)